MTEVCLIQMPYGPLERPSIGLGVLKAALREAEISCRVLYPNLWFAEEVGLDLYAAVNRFPCDTLIGEWTFAGSAFPEHRADHEGFFRLNRPAFESGDIEIFFRRLRDGAPPVEVLWEVRQAAPAFIDRVAAAVLEHRPRIVACTSTFQQHVPALALLRRIRELAPEVVSLIGGANCEGPMGGATHRAFPWVDFVVSGEADLLLPPLCRRILDEGRDVPVEELPWGVLGPSCRRGDGLGGRPPSARAVVDDLDRIPIPDYDDYFTALEASSLASYVLPGLPVETARGCWWGQKSHCTFCGLNGHGIAFRAKSAPRVLEELDELGERYGIRRFEAVDNIVDMDFFRTVFPALAERPEPPSTFFETKANLKRWQLELLAKAGVRFIQPGIESLHRGVLELVHKGTTPLLNVQLLKWGLELGIRIEWLFLFGVPGERDEWYAEMAEWLPLLVHLQPPSSMARIQFNRFSPYHHRPSDWGLTLSSNRSYRYVYPVSAAEADELAYFFEDYEDPLRGAIDPPGSERAPGLTAWARQAHGWRLAWMRPAPGTDEIPPTLTRRPSGAGTLVRDSRPGRRAPLHQLDELASAVLTACDAVVGERRLPSLVARQLGHDVAWCDVEPIVEDLRQRGLLLVQDGLHLSLPVAADHPPLPSVFPGGQMHLHRYLRDRSFERHALSMAPIHALPTEAAPPSPR